MLGDWSFEIGFVVLEKVNMKKLILLSGSPCVGKTTVGQYLFEQYENSAYLDGDWCWCVQEEPL